MLIPPSQENVRCAHELAADLIDIATDGKSARWRSWDVEAPKLSQSDRLVIITARLGQIAGLLRSTYVDSEPEDLSGRALGREDAAPASSLG